MKSIVENSTLKTDNTFLLKKYLKNASDTTCFTVKTANSPEEINQAKRLVHDVYVRQGLIEPSNTDLLTNKHREQQSNIVFLAYQNDKLTMTATAFLDTKLGLPGESLFYNAIGQFKVPHRKVVEVGALATVKPTMRLIHTFQDAVILYLKKQGFHDMLSLVHPKYESVYCQVLGNKYIAGPKAYPLVNNKPAILIHLDLTKYPRKNEQ
jgi:hypothetical protein